MHKILLISAKMPFTCIWKIIYSCFCMPKPSIRAFLTREATFWRGYPAANKTKSNRQEEISVPVRMWAFMPHTWFKSAWLAPNALDIDVKGTVEYRSRLYRRGYAAKVPWHHFSGRSYSLSGFESTGYHNYIFVIMYNPLHRVLMFSCSLWKSI